MFSRVTKPSSMEYESYLLTLDGFLQRFVFLNEHPYQTSPITLREGIFGPPNSKGYHVGTWSQIGGSLAGLASICLYDWSAHKDVGEIVLSKDAREKFSLTEVYMLLGMGITAGSAVFGAQSLPVLAMVNWAFLPPIGVFLETGCDLNLAINIILTLLGYIPGIIHALWVIFSQ